MGQYYEIQRVTLWRLVWARRPRSSRQGRYLRGCKASSTPGKARGVHQTACCREQQHWTASPFVHGADPAAQVPTAGTRAIECLMTVLPITVTGGPTTAPHLLPGECMWSLGHCPLQLCRSRFWLCHPDCHCREPQVSKWQATFRFEQFTRPTAHRPEAHSIPRPSFAQVSFARDTMLRARF